jgi:hypothetical protein
MSDSDISTFDIATFEEGVEILKKKLQEGWIYVIGDSPCLEILEDIVYPPRTKKNRDLWLSIATVGGKTAIFFLAKKTEELREFLGVSEEKFERLIGLEEKYDPSSQRCIHELCFFEGDREEAISIFVNNFRKIMEEEKRSL